MADTDAPSTASAITTAARPVRDEDGDLNPAFVAEIEAAIAAADGAALKDIAGDLHEADMGALIERLEHDDRPRLVELMGGAFDFTALTEVDDHVREDILDDLPNETIAEGVKSLDSDDAIYILEDLDQEDQDEVLASMPVTERLALARALEFPEGSAGRRMQTEVVAVPPFWSVGQTIDFLRETDDLPEQFYALYVVDPQQRLVGIVPLDRMMRAKRPTRISEIMTEADHVVAATDPQEDVARLFRDYNLVSIAVVDDMERLVGVVTFDDIVDVVDEEADAEIKALGGVNAAEELSDSVWEITRSRFLWLFVNLVTAFLASSVLKGFEDEMQKMVALAVLAPIVASQGGNAATQTMTVAVRALATRQLDSVNAGRIILRECMVGLLNGLAFALITGSIAGLWFASVGLGVVIGLAMIVNLLAGALGGILVPLAVEKTGADPAVASGPFVTTVTDVVGFLAFLGIAVLWFGLR